LACRAVNYFSIKKKEIDTTTVTLKFTEQFAINQKKH
jgi:hypothetical protein